MRELIERARAAAQHSREYGPGTNAPLLDELAAALEAARAEVPIERRALRWLAGGDSGASSKAICYHMLGMKSDGSFPWDPSDLGRCLRLLELFPEWKPRIREMARYSPQWAALVARWDELAEMMADEVGIDWSKGRRAPRTYDAMKDAIDQACRKGGCGEGVKS
jgi:hypothetical protein